MTENKFNRRKLLKNSAIASAGSLAAAGGVNLIAPIILPEKLEIEENRSYWSKVLTPASPSLNKDLDADVAIIGGGFTGLSSAYYIRKNFPSKRVVLLEAKACGNGASGRNGAMLLTLTEDRYMQTSSDGDLDKKLYDLTAANILTIQNIAAAVGIDCELETNGALQVCNTSRRTDEAREYVATASKFGIPAEFWDKEKTAQALGTPVYEGALFDPRSGQLHPGKLVNVFKAAAQSLGVEIYENSPVVHIEEGPLHRIELSNGYTVKATSLVLATNAYSSQLGYLRHAYTPLFDYVGITAPLSDSQLNEIGWKTRLPFNDSRTETYYLGLTRDNRIHIGGGPVDYCFNNGVAEPQSASRGYEHLSMQLARIFPKLAGLPFETTWSGLVDMSLDQSPAVGVMGKNKNIFYGIGFSGHGVNLTSLFGRIIADLEAGNAAHWSWLPFLNRFPLYTPNEPFRWLGIQVALRYYRLTDPKTP